MRSQRSRVRVVPVSELGQLVHAGPEAFPCAPEAVPGPRGGFVETFGLGQVVAFRRQAVEGAVLDDTQKQVGRQKPAVGSDRGEGISSADLHR